MNQMHAKVFTEPIVAQLAAYRDTLAVHPLLVAAAAGELAPALLHRFAFYQYSDSILWIPMLAQMKERAVRSPRLRRAIAENIAHEAGLDGVSHVLLAVQLMRSLRDVAPDARPLGLFERSAHWWLSDDFVATSEPAIAGWLLTAETLVPQLFAAIEPAFAALGADTTYFRVHVAVDSDEHAEWMQDAVEEIVALYGADCVPLVVSGMADAWDETIEIPDVLWRWR